MSLRVNKPFNTVNRRFHVGQEIAAGDDLSPHTAETLKGGGFIAEPMVASPVPTLIPAKVETEH